MRCSRRPWVLRLFLACAALGALGVPTEAATVADGNAASTIPDLGVTFGTRLDSGDAPVREIGPGEPPADIRLTANSDEVVSLAESPMNIARAWVAGRVKIDASMRDLLRLRKLL